MRKEGAGRKGSPADLILEVLGGLVCLVELPVAGRDVPGGGLAVVAGHDPERQRLAGEVDLRRPELAPAALHRRPLDALVALHRQPHHVPGAADVRYHHHVVVQVPRDRVPDAALPHARHPAYACVNCLYVDR